MTWRGSVTLRDRFLACLPYLLPLLDGLVFGRFFLAQFPALAVVLLPILPIAQLYNSFPFAPIIIFFALFLLVVRNENINHFIRFNAMQAILLDIIVFLCSIVLNLFGGALGTGLLMETLFNVVFFGLIAAIVYSVAQCIMGRYAEIPTISEAVHMQVR